MEKVYEELDEVKAANEKLRIEYRNKTELLDNLKKVLNEQSVEIQEARQVTEKQGFELEEKTREISDWKRTHEDLQRCLREKDSIFKRVNDANDKLRATGENQYREFEEEKRKLMSALDESSEKNIDLEQKNNVFRAEIEGLKGLLAAAEKKKMEAEKIVKDLKEMRGRDDLVNKLEEGKTQVEEKLKWKKEQFKHLEEAYEKLKNQFKDSKKEWEEERSTLLDEIYSLQTKLDSQTRISEDLQKKLQMCTSALTQEETRRKNLEIQVSEFKAKYEDAFVDYQDARTQLDDLAGKRDEEVAELRHTLRMKEAYFKEMKYENVKLEQENKELLGSLKELQESTIQGSGNSALSRLKNKFRNLENIHKNCSAILKSKEAEWSSQLKKMAEELYDYKSQLESKEAALKDVALELENFHSSAAKMKLQYDELSIMFLVLSRTVSEAQSMLANVKDEQIKDEKREEKSYSSLMEQLHLKNAALDKARLEIEEEREKVGCLLKRLEILNLFEDQNIQMQKEVEKYKELVEESSRFQTQMKGKMKEAENDYEEKLQQVCDALDNTNSELVAEREKVVALTRQIESLNVVQEKNSAMEKEIEKYKEMLVGSEKCQVLSEALETANSELSDKTSEVYQLEFQLWVWKSIAERLKTELEENHNLRKRVEASLLEQVEFGESMRQERNELMHRLKAISFARSSDSEKETLTRDNLQREVELFVLDSFSRELEDVVLARMIAEKELQNERDTFAGGIQQKEQELCEVKHEMGSSLESVSLLLEQKQNEANMIHRAWENLAAEEILTSVENEYKKMTIIELEEEVSSLSQKLKSSDDIVSCFRQEATKLGAELETKQRELTEAKTQMQEELRTSEAKKTELEKEVENLWSENRNLSSLINEAENGMLKLYDGDINLMKALERVTEGYDGFGKENFNKETIGSPRLPRKHEDVVTENRSPFRQLNH